MSQTTRKTLDPGPYRVTGPASAGLSEYPTRIKALYKSGREYRQTLHEHCLAIDEAQRRLFANGTDGVLVVVQGVDACGKDGLIRHVFRQVDPAGLHCWSFAEPSATQLGQDYLRRYQAFLPQLGHMAVFNRSYHEHVLTVRVHPRWLNGGAEVQGDEIPDAFWQRRFQEINNFERYLESNHIHVIKLMLHLSADEQRQRFLARLGNPDKQWKLHANDLRDRQYWNEFQNVYADCLRHTATEQAPWYVIPADDKRNARLLAAAIVERHIAALAGDWPRPTAEHDEQLAAARRQLEDEQRH
jgi:PPK2 family polyphosphate:nucleotide phosphotransferase